MGTRYRTALVVAIVSLTACGSNRGGGGGGGGPDGGTGVDAGICGTVAANVCEMACVCSATYRDFKDGTTGWCNYGGEVDFLYRRSETCVLGFMENNCRDGTPDSDWNACNIVLSESLCEDAPELHLVLPEFCQDFIFY